MTSDEAVMLVTVSGMVGSGKTTIARELVKLATDRGFDATTLRFQTLPCFTMLRSSVAPPRERGSRSAAVDPGPRWAAYRRKRLGLIVTLVYLARIISFRIYRWSWRSDTVHVLNRYFYDLFVHFELVSTAERVYFAMLRWATPAPDFAILAVAAAETIADRRENYSTQYLSEVRSAYVDLRGHFPELIELRTDPGEPTFELLERMASERLIRG